MTTVPRSPLQSWRSPLSVAAWLAFVLVVAGLAWWAPSGPGSATTQVLLVLLAAFGPTGVLVGQERERHHRREEQRQTREAEAEHARRRQLQDRSDQAVEHVMDRLDQIRRLWPPAFGDEESAPDTEKLHVLLDELERDAEASLDEQARGRVHLAVDACAAASRLVGDLEIPARLIAWRATRLTSRVLGASLRDEPLPAQPEPLLHLERALLDDVLNGSGLSNDQIREDQRFLVQRWHAEDRHRV